MGWDGIESDDDDPPPDSVYLNVSNARGKSTAHDVEVLLTARWEANDGAQVTSFENRPLAWAFVSSEASRHVTAISIPAGVTRKVEVLRIGPSWWLQAFIAREEQPRRAVRSGMSRTSSSVRTPSSRSRRSRLTTFTPPTTTSFTVSRSQSALAMSMPLSTRPSCVCRSIHPAKPALMRVASWCLRAGLYSSGGRDRRRADPARSSVSVLTREGARREGLAGGPHRLRQTVRLCKRERVREGADLHRR